MAKKVASQRQSKVPQKGTPRSGGQASAKKNARFPKKNSGY